MTRENFPTEKSAGFLSALVWGVLIAEVAYAAIIYFLRDKFPYDYYLWPESPFLTDLLKIHQGNWVYTSPAEANSYVYAPGLEYFNYAVLHPFGLALSLPAHRFLNCLYGILAAIAGACAATELSEKKNVGAAAPFLFSCLLLVMVLSENPLFDIPHPDNLATLFFALSLFLALRGYRLKKLSLLLGASCVAVLGILVKQTLCLVFAANTLALYFTWREGRVNKYWLIFPAVLTAIVLGIFLALPYARFYTLDLLSRQGFDMIGLKTQEILRIFTAFPFLLSCFVFWRWFTGKQGGQTRNLFLIGAAFFLLAVAPAIVAHYKINGAYNNLIIAFFALFILFLPALYEAAFLAKSPVGAITVLLLAVMFVPLKKPPTPGLEKYAQALQAAVDKPAHEGKSVLLANGTAALIRAGIETPPKDRASSILELSAGNADSLSQTRTVERIRHRVYDVIIINTIWYVPEIWKAVTDNYVLTAKIRGPNVFAWHWGKYTDYLFAALVPWWEGDAGIYTGIQSIDRDAYVFGRQRPIRR